MAMAACPRLAGDTWSDWSLTRAEELLVHSLHGGQLLPPHPTPIFSACSLWLGPGNYCFFCHSWVPQAVLVATVLSALLGQSGGAFCWRCRVQWWLVKISSPGQAWQKCLHSPVWPDSNDRLYSVVGMTTEQCSTSMQNLSQGNTAQSVSGQGSCYCE